jgi:hypothetical protein
MIKNYTTEVPAMKSIGQIQFNLAAHGATAIMVHYGTDHEPESLAFVIPTPQGEIPFRLPANVKKLEALLLKQLSISSYHTFDTQYQAQRKHKVGEQAKRVAWRIIKDWVDAQLAIIETEMVTIEQVFLPYMQVKNGQTLYQVMQEKRFMLTMGDSK